MVNATLVAAAGDITLSDTSKYYVFAVAGVAVGVAAVREPAPWALEAVLPAAQPGAGLGGDVLDEQQLSVGPQQPPDLAERRVEVGHGAQHQRGDDGVGAVVG